MVDSSQLSQPSQECHVHARGSTDLSSRKGGKAGLEVVKRVETRKFSVINGPTPIIVDGRRGQHRGVGKQMRKANLDINRTLYREQTRPFVGRVERLAERC